MSRGQILSIIGPIGAGKSTLFNSDHGVSLLDKGRVLFKGLDITNWKPHTIGKLGVVRTFQITQDVVG